MPDQANALTLTRRPPARQRRARDPHPDLMSVAEAAAELNVCGMTIRRGIYDDAVPFVKVRGRYWIPRSFVTRALADAEAGFGVVVGVRGSGEIAGGDEFDGHPSWAHMRRPHHARRYRIERLKNGCIRVDDRRTGAVALYDADGALLSGDDLIAAAAARDIAAGVA